MNKSEILLFIMMIGIILSCHPSNRRGKDAASGIEGTWRMDIDRRGGVTLSTYFILQQNDTVLDGKIIINGAVDLALKNPHMDGEDGVFDTDWNISYRLHPEKNKLRITITYHGNHSEQATAVRVPAPEALPPDVIPLPEIRTVPSNGLARTPPMGWNSWNHFGDKVDDAIVRAATDRLISSGLAAAGYVYVNIDDCWEGGRDEQGNIVPNEKFPDMKSLADYVHDRGLKLGIYSSPGPRTCGGYEGSFGHEVQDAQTWSEWGIDYLKYDWCSAARIYSNEQLQAAYQKMGIALQKAGRPIVYSLCEYGMNEVWKWGPQAGANLWRTTGDIQDNWESMIHIGFGQGPLAPYAGPGHWNDPDMLEVGNGGMSDTEYRTHFSLWCLLAAPLMAGNDLNDMSAQTLEILGNREVIAIDQDPLGQQAVPVFDDGAVRVWARDLHDGTIAAGLFNTGETDQKILLDWQDIGISGRQKIRDLWKHEDLGTSGSGFESSVGAHGVVFIKITPVSG